jgi:hypothetical protein
MADKQPQRVLGPDGFGYSPARNRELDDLAVATFGRGAGREFLSYLRSITIEAVGGPEITNDQLRHREGARYLVGIIEQRIAAGHKRRRAKHEQPAG